MAQILRVPLLRHLRAEPSAHVLHYQKGRLRRSGRGLSFWYRPLVSGLAEVPLDDREQAFLFTGRSHDFQDVSVQGAITYRVARPEELAKRLDFSIDVDRGVYLKKPFEQLAGIVAQLAQQIALDYIAHQPLLNRAPRRSAGPARPDRSVPARQRRVARHGDRARLCEGRESGAQQRAREGAAGPDTRDDPAGRRRSRLSATGPGS
jgi:hypothetical protein